MIVSPVPEPRLIVPLPMTIASSCAPLSVTASLFAVPVRLPVSTLIVGRARAEMLPLARTFSTSVPPPRLIALKVANCAAVIVTVSLPPLPVSVSTPETVPTVKSTVVPLFVSTIWSRVPLPVLPPPLIDSPATNWPLPILIVSSPLPATIVSAPAPPVKISPLLSVSCACVPPANPVSVPLEASATSLPLPPVNVASSPG